jgi:hypothetical protein
VFQNSNEQVRHSYTVPPSRVKRRRGSRFYRRTSKSHPDEKEKALRNYKNCTQQWLVIGEGGDFYSYMDKIEIKNGFKTDFDKVFICRDGIRR